MAPLLSALVAVAALRAGEARPAGVTFPDDCPLVLFLGRVNPDKGIAPMIAAARQVWAAFPTAHFLFVGPFEWGSEALCQAEPDPRLIARPAQCLRSRLRRPAEGSPSPSARSAPERRALVLPSSAGACTRLRLGSRTRSNQFGLGEIN